MTTSWMSQNGLTMNIKLSKSANKFLQKLDPDLRKSVIAKMLKQLYIKGKKLLASTVWQDMVINKISPEDAADNWDLPIAAIQEVIDYCDCHQDLIALESAEKRHRLEAKGVSLEPQPIAR